MTWWQALILGLVQGASEFLPVSSSGHLILLEKLGVGTESLPFNITVHVGTLVAVLIVMRKSWTGLLRHPLQKKTGYLLLACLPTVALALMFNLLFPSMLEGELLGFGFVLTACLLFAAEKFKPAKPALLTPKTSILTGVLQGIAVLPGVSRSGATISALSLGGVGREEAADFSFVLSIPIILGSAALEGVELATSPVALDVPVFALAIGAAAAFLSGLLSASLFLKLIKNHSMLPFALYTLILGIVVTLLPLFGVKI